MDLFVDDDVFVRAPNGLVYRHLRDLEGWNTWWPGVATRRMQPSPGVPAGEGDAWSVSWRSGVRRLCFVAEVHGSREGLGFHLALTGTPEGRSEFWLEPAYGGTVVHHLLVATAEQRPITVLRTYRRVLRRGFWRLKDDLQAAVREHAGLLP